MSLTVRKSARLADPGAELLEKGTALWDRYGRFALGALAAVVLVVAITILTMRSRAASEEQAAGRLSEANVLFWQGDYTRSLELSRQVIQQYPSTPSGIDAHRLAADNAYWDGDFKTAVTEYKTYLDKQKKGLLADAARKSLAYALESNGQLADAATTYDAMVGKFDRETSAEMLAGAARCYHQNHQNDEATKHLRRLLDEYGETNQASIARIELAEWTGASH